MSDEFEEKRAEYGQKFQAARYSFWPALLTVNAVLLTVPAALLSVRPEIAAWPFKIVGVCSIGSMVALVFNFAASKAQYEFIGKRMADVERDLADEERHKDIQQALGRHAWIQRSEMLVMGLLLIQMVALGYVFAHA